METHLTDGEVRAALDGELGEERRQHLEMCGECRRREGRMRGAGEGTERLLRSLQAAEERGPSARQAWAKFTQKIAQGKEHPVKRTWFTNPLFRYGTAALALLVLVLTIPSTRALAGELLKLFRVQEVTVVPVDFTGLEQLTGDGDLGNRFTDLISDSIDMQKEPGDPTQAANAAEASQLAGFEVRLPAGASPSQIYVSQGAAFSMKIDRARTQALLDEAGRSDLVLPESVDGANISVGISPSVSAAFGTCPKPGSDVVGNSEQSRTERLYPDCVILAQIPSPTVNAPADLDIEALARLGLEFTGMSSEEAAEFTRTVDWTSTLVVPIPQNASTHEQVSVDGVTGTLIQRSGGEMPQFALLWVKDGIIYTISGLGANAQQAIEMANSLE